MINAESSRENVDLEILGFLSFGLVHQYSNTLARIRLLAEFGSEESRAAGRESLEQIIGEVDSSWSRRFLKTWFSGGPSEAEERMAFDAVSLGEVCSILTYSCRHFLTSYSYSIDADACFSGSCTDLGLCVVLPAARYCAGLQKDKRNRSCLMCIRSSSEGCVEVEYRFSHSTRVIETLKPWFESLWGRDIYWAVQSGKQNESLIFRLPAVR